MNVKHTQAHLRPFNLMQIAEFRRSCTREARPVQLAGSGQRPEGAPRNWVTRGRHRAGPNSGKPAPDAKNRRSFGRLFAVSAPEQNDEDAVGSAWRERRVA